MDDEVYKQMLQITGQYLWTGIVLGLAAGFIGGAYW
jgi:hypothetical protein